MNKSFIKQLADFGPLLIFFIVYYKSGKNMGAAIPPLIIATIVSVIVIYWIEKKIPYIPLFGAFLISIFGGLSLYFSNPKFLYVKPTIINLIFSFVLFSGKFFDKNFLKILLSNKLDLNQMGWEKLNNRWAFFFIFLALINEIIWRTQTESIWVNFKVWGVLPLTLIFTIFQIPLLNKYKNEKT